LGVTLPCHAQLSEVKSLAKRCNATVNDILLSALTGALRNFELQRAGPQVRVCSHEVSLCKWDE
jgi:hypothetical protein